MLNTNCKEQTKSQEVKDGDKEYHLLGHNAVLSVESQPTFRRKISPPFLGSNKPRKAPACKQVASHVSVKEIRL
jgi:hypothetical protein